MTKKLRPSAFWTFPRGSWQYDLIVIAILAFIFLVPQEFFGDQPRSDSVQQIRDLSDDKGTLVFWVDSDLFKTAPNGESAERLQRLLKKRTGRNLRIVETRPQPDPDGVLRAYLVYARP